MFWWLYKSPRRNENSSNPWPTILWLQGGPVISYLVMVVEIMLEFLLQYLPLIHDFRGPLV